MYRYFISFTHNTPEESGYGNVIVETNLEFSEVGERVNKYKMQ